MKSASWLMYEDDYVLRQCGACGFSTRSPSTYRRHSRNCTRTSSSLVGNTAAKLPKADLGSPADVPQVNTRNDNCMSSAGNGSSENGAETESAIATESLLEKVVRRIDENLMTAISDGKSCSTQENPNIGAKTPTNSGINSEVSSGKQYIPFPKDGTALFADSSSACGETKVYVIKALSTVRQQSRDNSSVCSSADGERDSTGFDSSTPSSQNYMTQTTTDKMESDGSHTNQHLEETSTDPPDNSTRNHAHTSEISDLPPISGGSKSVTPKKSPRKNVKSAVKFLVCQRCDFRSALKSEMTVHIRVAHAAAMAIHRCTECEYQSLDYKNLERHLVRHLLAGSARCALCSFSSSVGCVRRHMSAHHTAAGLTAGTAPIIAGTDDNFDKHEGSSSSADQTEFANREPEEPAAEADEDAISEMETSDIDDHCTAGSNFSSTVKMVATGTAESRSKFKPAAKRSDIISASTLQIELSDAAHLASSSKADKIPNVALKKKRGRKPKVVAKLPDTVDRADVDRVDATSMEVSPDEISNTSTPTSSDGAEGGCQKPSARKAELEGGDVLEVKAEFGGTTGEETIWTCVACGAQYDKRSKIRRHVKTKHDVSMYDCKLTDLRSDTSLNFPTPEVAAAGKSDSPDASVPKDSPENHLQNLVPEKITTGKPGTSDKLVKTEMVTKSVPDSKPPDGFQPFADVPEKLVKPYIPIVSLRPPQKLAILTAGAKTPPQIVSLKKAVVIPQKVWKNISFRPVEAPKPVPCITKNPPDSTSCPSAEKDSSGVTPVAAVSKDPTTNSSNPSLIESDAPPETDPDQNPAKVTSGSPVSDNPEHEQDKELENEVQATSPLYLYDAEKRRKFMVVMAARKDPPLSPLKQMSPKKLKCAHCSFASHRILELRRHLMAAHSEEKKYACPECDCCYRHESSLYLHRRHKHQKNPSPADENEASSLDRSTADEEEDHDVPNATTAEKRNIEDVVAEVGEEVPKRCKKSVEFEMKTESVESVVEKSGEIPEVVLDHQQPVPVVFKRRKNWKRYFDIGSQGDSTAAGDGGSAAAASSEPDGYLCRHCGYIAKNAYLLEKHVKIHTGQHDYWCRQPDCSYRTIWSCDMKRHIYKFHTEILEKNTENMRDLIRKTYRPGGRTPPTSPQRRSKIILDDSSAGATPDESTTADSSSRIVKRYKQRAVKSKLEAGRSKDVHSDATDKNDNATQHPSNPESVATNPGGGEPAAASEGTQSSKHDQERYRPFKCSECGRRSNWQWDLKKHIANSHPGAKLIQLSPEIARATFSDILRRITAKKSMRCGKEGVWRWCNGRKKKTCEDGSSGTCGSVDSGDASIDQIDNDGAVAAAGGKPMSELEKVLTDHQGNSIGMIDMLRLRRFQCTGCPYRSNHRGDIGRHIRMRHGRGTCRITILSTEEAAATLHAYRIRWNRKKAWLSGSAAGSEGLQDSGSSCDRPEDGDGGDWKGADSNVVEGGKEKDARTGATEFGSRHDRISASSGNHHANKDLKFSEPAPDDAVLRRKIRECVGDDRMDATKCCDICPFRTDRTGLLVLHKLRHRAPSPGTTAHDGAAFSCPHCPYFVRTSRQLERHTALHDGVVSRADPSTEENNGASSANHNNGLKTKYICESCPFFSFHRNEYWIHRRQHLKHSTYACTFCAFWVSDRRSFSEHLRLHKAGYYPRIHSTNSVLSRVNSQEEIPSSKPSISASSSKSAISDPEELKACPLLEPVQPSDFVISDQDVAESWPLLEAETAIATQNAGIICPPLLQPEIDTPAESSLDGRPVVFQTAETQEESELPDSALPSAVSSSTDIVSYDDISAAKCYQSKAESDHASVHSSDETCRCALQCPYCYFSIASSRLLRQHVIFHVAVSDAVSAPLFDERFDNMEDGSTAVDDVRYGVVRSCGRCRRLKSLADESETAVDLESELEDKQSFFAGLCLKYSTA